MKHLITLLAVLLLADGRCAETISGKADPLDPRLVPTTGIATGGAVKNLALNRPYTLEPRPNYPHCTDAEDAHQLTDGRLTSGYFWTQTGTVGWSARQPVILTVDLGSVQPISGASFRTAAGVAGVGWPQAIDLLTSDDGKSFHQAGELVSLSARQQPAPATGFAVHTYRTLDLRTHGRHVAFVVNVSGNFAFTDEVEVFQGDAAWVKEPLPGDPVDDLSTFFREGAVQAAVERRLREDSRAVRERVTEARLAPDIEAHLLQQLATIEAGLPDLPRKQAEGFRAVLPLKPSP